MKNIEVGDQVVIINCNQSGQPYTIAKVVRATKTRIAIEDGREFMRRSGKLVGGSGWYTDSLNTWGDVTIETAIEANAEWHKEHGLKIRRSEVRNFDWSRVADEKIIRIKAILDEPDAVN